MERPFIDQPLPGETPPPKRLERLVSDDLYTILEKNATTDPLTGLLNRGEFKRKIEEIKDIILSEELQGNNHKHLENIAYAILILDIDHFKSFNDTYGHSVGDAVLKSAATFFTNHFRPSDTICRWGGEEFVILLQDFNKPDFLNLLNKRLSDDGNPEKRTLNFPIEIIGATATDGKKHYRVPEGENYTLLPNETLIKKTITFSGGLASFSPDKEDLDKKIDDVDKHMYEAKMDGRDHIRSPDFE